MASGIQIALPAGAHLGTAPDGKRAPSERGSATRSTPLRQSALPPSWLVVPPLSALRVTDPRSAATAPDSAGTLNNLAGWGSALKRATGVGMVGQTGQAMFAAGRPIPATGGRRLTDTQPAWKY